MNRDIQEISKYSKRKKQQNTKISSKDRVRLDIGVGNEPWVVESDLVDWIDSYTKYHCRVLRHEVSLHLCGYVRLPEGHSLRDKDIVEVCGICRTHGGVTFAELWDKDNEAEGYWIGFDCSHCDDYCPGRMNTESPDQYRDLHYVMQEVRFLAKDLFDYQTEREIYE
jgi:hypothetical protein